MATKSVHIVFKCYAWEGCEPLDVYDNLTAAFEHQKAIYPDPNSEDMTYYTVETFPLKSIYTGE